MSYFKPYFSKIAEVSSSRIIWMKSAEDSMEGSKQPLKIEITA